MCRFFPIRMSFGLKKNKTATPPAESHGVQAIDASFRTSTTNCNTGIFSANVLPATLTYHKRANAAATIPSILKPGTSTASMLTESRNTLPTACYPPHKRRTVDSSLPPSADRRATHSLGPQKGR